MIENLVEFGIGIGLQHSHTRVAEVWNALEQRRGGKVATYVQDAPILVDAVDALVDLPAQQQHLFMLADRVDWRAVSKEMLHLAKNPRAAD